VGDPLAEYRKVFFVDYEFSAPPGERPRPVCLVAQELRSGEVVQVWEDDLHQMYCPPFPITPDTLYIAYYASAELGCHLALGWPLPYNVLDLYTEFRTLTNGKPLVGGRGLVGALMHYGLDAMDATEKDSMRMLAIRGGPWTADERRDLLAYCESDVVALAKLLPRMLPHIDLPQALLRGRYMKAAARMEHTGIPVDVAGLSRIQAYWGDIQDSLINRINDNYGVYDGRTFKADRWAAWLSTHGISWPMLESGRLAMDDDTFREMSRAHPSIAPLRELRVAMSQMRRLNLAVGSDNRNRLLISAFQSKTGRNQPSTTKFIFGPAVWLRSLIQPPPGWGLAYVDWSQQEFGIAAALSGDEAMMDAYATGDPYMAFAIQAGAAPVGASKKTHGNVRGLFKACVLAVQYSMGAKSLSMRIGQSEAEARELLRLHRETYWKFWQWSDAAVDHAMIHNRLWTVFGWNIFVGDPVNPRSLRNFPMQANGAEMLRLACCLATERNIRVCAPIHDALLVEAPLEDLDDTILTTQKAMADASNIVLDGFRLRTDVEVVRHPDRYMDGRGEKMWTTVQELLDEIDPRPPAATQAVRSCSDTRSPEHTRSISSLSSRRSRK